MRFLYFLPLLACEEKLGDLTDAWGGGVESVELNSETSGNLSNGFVLDDLSWSSNSSVACWPGNEDINFMGTHVFYSAYQTPHSKLTATVIPQDASVDVNVYMLQQSTNSYQVPPDVTSVVSCEVGFPQSTDSNPGEQDSAYVIAIEKEYNVLIGVAGPQDVNSGAYTLRLEIEDY